LIRVRNDILYKNPIQIPNNNILFIKYALCKFSEEEERYEISLEEILNERKLLGKVYNMNSVDIINALTMLENDLYYKIEFTKTNNLDIVKLPRIKVNEFLEKHMI